MAYPGSRVRLTKRGPAGPRSQFFSGEGAPGTITGQQPGDAYLDAATGDFYKRAATSWTFLRNLNGPPGPGTGEGAWAPATAYVAGQVVQAPDGSLIQRKADGASGATFDTTERGAWSAIEAIAGSMAHAGIAATFATFDVQLSYGAVGDGTTDDTAAFTAAAADAAAVGADVYVPAPEATYYLATDPVVPDGVGFGSRPSPDWFSGPGKLPFDRYIGNSEGIDSRIFRTKVLGFAEPDVGEDHRNWAVVGWVNYKNAPDATAAGSARADAVGVDGRGHTEVKNGRVWGLLGLVTMTPGAKADGNYGVSQAYAGELDVNNNTGEDCTSLDGGNDKPLILGLSIVSGGDNGPGEAVRVDATRKPGDPNWPAGSDNRWHTAFRVRGDAVRDYALHMDDGFAGVAVRIPTGGLGNHWTDNGVVYFAEYQDVNDKRRKMWSQQPGYGYDFVDADQNRVLSTNDGSIQAGVPLRRATTVIPAIATIDANNADVQVLYSSGVTAVNGITGGYDGQRLTIVNVTGGTLTVNEGTNMRMAGTSFAMSDASTIEFIYSEPTWFEVSRSTNS